MAVTPFKLEELSRLLDQGRFEQVETELAKLGRISPGDPNLAALLVSLFSQTGRFEQAAYAAERRAALLPNDLRAQSALVDVLLAARKTDEAILRAQRIYEKAKSSPGAVLVLGAALLHVGRVSECAALLGERLEAGVKSDDLLGIRASALLAMGHGAEAASSLHAILARTPGHPFALSLLASVLTNVPGTDPDEHFRVHLEYGQAMAKRQPPAPRQVRTTPPVPLTVAMISADLHEHSVARFVEPIVRHADCTRVRVALISMSSRPDSTSTRLASLANSWHDLRPMSWQRLSEICAAEKVDVLIELGGHMTNSPLPFMMPRIAGSQGSAIGYPNTTGLPTINFRIVDSVTDPPGASDRRATEKLLRIDPCFLCFQPPDAAPDVSALPAERNGFVTFGSFNALSKLHDSMLADWSELLRRVAGSRLHIKALALDDPGTRRDLEERASRAGIAADRLTLLGKKGSTREHLDCYHDIDIALDTFPYHGTTTTCEAMWMGVPVVTRAGETHASRVGASLLHAAGMSRLVARDRESYLHTAESLANDPPALAAIRAGLREQIRASALCDGAAYAKRWAEAIIAEASASRA